MTHTKITIWFCLMLLIAPSSTLAGGPSLSLDTFQVNFSTPTAQALNDGYIDKDSRTNIHAFKIRIDGGNEGRGWQLFVRADNRIFSPGVHGKPCEDLKWKFDHENANAYRRVRTNNQFVASGSGKATNTQYIDLRMMLDWSDPSAGYSIGLTFTLITE